MTSPQKLTPAVTAAAADLDRVRDLALPIARAAGAELVAVEWKSDGRGFVLRVLIDKEGSAERRASTQDSAVDLEVCANVSRALSAALDVAEPDPVPGHYSLEVGSPGVERELRGEADFVRFEGQKAKLRLSAPRLGQRVVVGVLSGVADGQLRLALGGDGAPVAVPLTTVTSARLVFELGASPKPGKKTRK
jgi:ribosome maturation factor RimP